MPLGYRTVGKPHEEVDGNREDTTGADDDEPTKPLGECSGAAEERATTII